MSDNVRNTDVFVIGAGNAAFCAPLADREQGAQVVVPDVADEDEAHGNSRYTAGAIRFAHEGIEDFKRILPDLSASEIDNADFGVDQQHDFFDDMFRVTRYRADAERVETSLTSSLDTVAWMREKACIFSPHTIARPSRPTRASFASGEACASRPGAVACFTSTTRAAPT